MRDEVFHKIGAGFFWIGIDLNTVFNHLLNSFPRIPIKMKN
jgi:hypothetical protein